MIYSFINNELTVTLSKTLYPDAVLYKCFYWYTANYQVRIIEADNDQWNVILIIKHDQASDENLQMLKERISRDLIDFKLRQIVSQETRPVRELLIAKAFALHEIEENPVTDVSDPVGFNPADVTIYEQPLPNS